ncbi:hypothetical protein [Rhizobium sp. Root491]|uniref:hypothetical protein n=1 Tax=Rhizobium sp. Root491 TaxID=1736548 RepID=UPI002B22C3AD|nr:hypothetical protein [Rhizobium sp. Root491]
MRLKFRNIEEAYIGNLQVGTSNIASGAISDAFEVSQSGSTPQSLVVNHGTGAPRIYLFYSSELVTANNQIGAQIRYDINNDTDGGVIGSIGSVNPGVNNGDIVSASSFRIFVPPSGRTQTTFWR